MTKAEIRKAVLQALRTVAPEIDLQSVESDVPIREQFDIDSVDLLAFLTELESTLGVTVPEADYEQVTTIDDCVAYLAERVDGGTTG